MTGKDIFRWQCAAGGRRKCAYRVKYINFELIKANGLTWHFVQAAARRLHAMRIELFAVTIKSFSHIPT